MTVNVENFKGAFSEMARANRFEVTGFRLNNDLPFMVKAASLPAATVGTLELPYQGRQIKLAGDRLYPDWTLTIYQDDSAFIRREIEQWQNEINDPVANAGHIAHQAYKRDGQVYMMDRAGGDIQAYKIKGAVPVELGALELAWDTNDTPAEYTLTLAFDYYELV